MLKAINGPYDDSDPHSVGVRSYARAGGAEAAVIGAPDWAALEPTRGAPYDESAWAGLDAQVRAAREDGLRTFVVCWERIPEWAYARQAAGRAAPRQSGWRLAPDDRTAHGPWAGYLLNVLERHPHVQGILPLNEPNAAFMDGGVASLDTAQMIRSAVTLWRAAKATPRLLVPATLDGPGSVTFTAQVLSHLERGWDPGDVRVGWAHHPYTDVAHGLPRSPTARPQVERVLELLGEWRWKAGRQVWLTEGGWQYHTHMTSTQWQYAYDEPLGPQQEAQLANVTRHYRWCRDLPDRAGRVMMWANYLFKDYEWGGGGFMSGLRALDGTPHPLHDVWRTL